MKTKNLLQIMLVVLLLVLSFSSVVKAQVAVLRGGEENPVITIGKSTLYGAGTGVLLGLALSLVVDEDFGEIMKWSFVGGTIGGFAIGVIHVATRSKPSSAMLQFDSGRLAKVTVPRPELRLNSSKSLDFRVNLVSLSL